MCLAAALKNAGASWLAWISTNQSNDDANDVEDDDDAWHLGLRGLRGSWPPGPPGRRRKFCIHNWGGRSRFECHPNRETETEKPSSGLKREPIYSCHQWNHFPFYTSLFIVSILPSFGIGFYQDWRGVSQYRLKSLIKYRILLKSTFTLILKYRNKYYSQ